MFAPPSYCVNNSVNTDCRKQATVCIQTLQNTGLNLSISLFKFEPEYVCFKIYSGANNFSVLLHTVALELI